MLSGTGLINGFPHRGKSKHYLGEKVTLIDVFLEKDSALVKPPFEVALANFLVLPVDQVLNIMLVLSQKSLYLELLRP